MSTKAGTQKVSYRWHLRMRMAERGMYATSDLLPLLAERGVVLSREQVYRLVAHVPERLSLTTLAALCDALGISPAELVEPVRAEPKAAPAQTASTRGAVQGIRPRRARVARKE
ncbi:MAG: helix-turn-helix transcriptional regulator [Acidimicrobiales bacterium]|jgi:DNA-binding Xre family transcriptional regulator